MNTVAERDLAVSQGKPSVIQMEYNILRQDAAASFARAKAAGIGVIARMPVRRGFMSGSIDESYEFSEGDRRKQMFSPENIRTLHGELGHLQDEADKLGNPPCNRDLVLCVEPERLVCPPWLRTTEQSIQNASLGRSLPIEVVRKLQD